MTWIPAKEDDGPHRPMLGDNDDWQESLAFQFFDSRNRVGGYHHVGLQRRIDRADMWSWLAVEGRTVHNFQDLNLRVPKRDFPAFKLGPLSVISTAPLTGRDVFVDDGTTQLSLSYTAFDVPRHYGISDGNSANFAVGHFETVGRAIGNLKIGDRVLPIDAAAFDDRSWGERNWRSVLSHRFLFASFGADLYLALYSVVSPTGLRKFGFLTERGVNHEIIDIDIDVTVASNGIYAKSFEAVAWTRDGGGYRLSGRADGNLVVTQRHGFMQSPTLCRMEMNGRIGGGILEVNELKRPSPEITAVFGLTPHAEDSTVASSA